DPSSGRRSEQWVTGLVYAAAGEAERLWRELRAADPRREIPEQWLVFEPVDFIPELQMLVQVFPFDRKLPNLRLVLDGAAHQLDPLLLAGLEPGRWRIEERTIEPMRYRTELGAALRYTLGACDRVTGKGETRAVGLPGAASAGRGARGGGRGRSHGRSAGPDPSGPEVRPHLRIGRPGVLHRSRLGRARRSRAGPRAPGRAHRGPGRS